MGWMERRMGKDGPQILEVEERKHQKSKEKKDKRGNQTKIATSKNSKPRDKPTIRKNGEAVTKRNTERREAN